MTNNLPKLIEAGIQLIIALAGGLIKGIPQLVSKIPEIIKSIVGGFAEFIGSIGDIGKKHNNRNLGRDKSHGPVD